MSIPSTLISGFIGLASCGSMGVRILHSLWLIEVDPHRGGSISLRPARRGPCQSPEAAQAPGLWTGGRWALAAAREVGCLGAAADGGPAQDATWSHRSARLGTCGDAGAHSHISLPHGESVSSGSPKARKSHEMVTWFGLYGSIKIA